MISPSLLVREHGGRYATGLGIDLATDGGERFRWFIAAILFGIWSKAAPPLPQLALAAARHSGYLRHGRLSADHALETLQQVWITDGNTANDFADFEAALVREGLRLRREESRHRRRSCKETA